VSGYHDKKPLFDTYYELALIQNIPQIFSGALDGDLCSGTFLPKAPDLDGSVGISFK